MKDFDSTIHTLRSEDESGQAAETLQEAREPSTVDGTEAGPTKMWRSLDDLAETPDFQEMLHRELPRQAAELGNVDRRRFLQLSGASLGLAGLAACAKQPPEKVVAYVRQPEDIVPGKPMFFATAVNRTGFAQPVLAESHMGRPTKLEGNPEHPASRGGTDALTQADTLNLYDPDRNQSIYHLGQIRTWDAFLAQAEGLRGALTATEGEGLAVVTGAVTSPTLNRLLGELQAELPKAKRYTHEPLAGHEEAGIEQATGSRGQLSYDFKKADVVLAVDSNFTDEGPNAVRYAKDFATRRKAHDVDQASSMSRLYSVESMPHGVSVVADHRLAVKPSEMGKFLLAVAAKLGVAGASAPAGGDERWSAWVDEVAADLQAHAGSSAVIVGPYLDADTHALALAVNDALGNIGQTVHLQDSLVGEGFGSDELVADLDGGKISTLVLLNGVNPVYDSPADVDFAAAMQKATVRIYNGPFIDETAELCQWQIPESHCLESWGDLMSGDGVATLVQPIVNPLYLSKTSVEVVAALLGRGTETSEALVQETWSGWHETDGAAAGANADFTKFWRRSLHDGFVLGTEAVAKVASIDGSAAAAALASAQTSDVEILFRPDPSVLDGRYANNAWMQECPKPITKLTWDNALLMSPATAEAKVGKDLLPGNEQRDKAPLVTLDVGGNTLDVAVWVVPGMADDTFALHLGYGRTTCGAVAAGTGFDANAVRTSANLWHAAGPSVAPTGEKYLIACTQDHHSTEGREPVRSTNVQTYEAHPDSPLNIHHHFDVTKTLMPGDDFPYNSYRWGMAIDLTSCTGCNACLVACVSENNIPAIGKDQVRKGREMHWIRVDRYFAGDDPNNVDEILSQPVPCMQCEQAPCEVVCPVAATVHSDEGLNDMVYNRCVGTRYCSNNCPYKVRRFNFLLYQDFDTPQLKLGRNPDVTVRSRGVMEKCTYCVQRINGARIEAHRQGKRIQEGDVVTACQQACPSDAIYFGDLSDPESAVSKAKHSAIDYSLLEELGTRPRTTYLGRVRNPNPQLWARLYPDVPLVAERAHHGGHGDGHGGGHGDDHGGGHGDAHGGDTHGGDTHGEPASHAEDHGSAEEHGAAEH